jgi:hypothetical protein
MREWRAPLAATYVWSPFQNPSSPFQNSLICSCHFHVVFAKATYYLTYRDMHEMWIIEEYIVIDVSRCIRQEIYTRNDYLITKWKIWENSLYKKYYKVYSYKICSYVVRVWTFQQNILLYGYTACDIVLLKKPRGKINKPLSNPSHSVTITLSYEKQKYIFGFAMIYL